MEFGVGLHPGDGMATHEIILTATATLFWQFTATTIASRNPVLYMTSWISLKAKALSLKSIFLVTRDTVGTANRVARMAMTKKPQNSL